MIRKILVENFRYGSRFIDFYSIVDDDGIPIFAPSMFLFNLALSGLSKNTIRSYASDLTTFFSILAGDAGVANNIGRDYREITDAQMTTYIDWYLLKEKCLSAITVERHKTTISKFYKFAFNHGLIPKRMTFSFAADSSQETSTPLQTITKKLHQTYITKEQFDKIMLPYVNTSNPFLRERNELALCLGYYAGFRTEELVIKGNLAIDKLKELLPQRRGRSPEAITLSVKGKNKKTRDIPINVELTDRIYKFLYGRAKAVKTSLICNLKGEALRDAGYGTNLFTKTVNNYLAKNTLSERDVLVWKGRHYHTLRHCFATNSVGFCIEKGLDPRIFVPQWMGHNEPSTTDLYIFYDAVWNNRVDALKKLDLSSSKFGSNYKKRYKKG